MPESTQESAFRISRTVFASVAFGMIALYAAFTAAPLVAEDLAGTRTWSGIPGAAAILGTSVGAAALSGLMSRRGRRPGLVLGWGLGATGALAAVGAIALGSLALFIAAMVVLGIGHGSNQLARFTAAEAHAAERRGTVLSLVVWVGTIGAVVGPNLLEPSGPAAQGLGLARLSGGYLTAAAAFALAALVASTLPRRAAPTGPGTGGDRHDGRWGRHTVVAVTALIAAQFVMLLIMTMTPVHIRGHEHSLATVGAVMSAHFAGMFALAPIAGKASDRFGALRVTLTGLVMVAAAGALAAVAPTAAVGALGVALLLLGLGWSAAFVASSALLAKAGVRVQGRADAVGWAFAALASVSSGVLIAGVGYSTMCTIGVVIALLAAVVVTRELRIASPVLVAPPAEPAA